MEKRIKNAIKWLNNLRFFGKNKISNYINILLKIQLYFKKIFNDNLSILFFYLNRIKNA